MKITGIECKKCGDKLFSLNRHDFKMCSCKTVGVDGGADYTKITGNHENFNYINRDISEIIEDIRVIFYWGQNYDKNGDRLASTKFILLKDLTTGHIIGILKYFTENMAPQDDYEKTVSLSWVRTHLIFLEELLYRIKHNLL